MTRDTANRIKAALAVYTEWSRNRAAYGFSDITRDELADKAGRILGLTPDEMAILRGIVR